MRSMINAIPLHLNITIAGISGSLRGRGIGVESSCPDPAARIYYVVYRSRIPRTLDWIKIPKKMPAVGDHKGPTGHPKGRVCSHPTSPMASLSHSNARGSPDRDADLCTVPGSCPLQGRADSIGDPPALFPRRRPARTAAETPARISASSSATPSILRSWS
ncbi:unnamed protein product [Cuscuta europaea]|uniref:Uncharacterized protein n=1 Tax=Cuscuta europaea TaxID=41803 RepID=A0A9P0Z906_CUSEU|nr:unnamed protein product [Cuscuta europaea]